VPKKIYFGLAIAWTLFMLFLCLEDSNDLPKIKIQNLDKIVHAGFHFVFVVIWFLYIRISKALIDNKVAIKNAFWFSVLFGISIEFLQYFFTTTRKADVLDVLSNCIGAIIAVFVIQLWNNKQKSKTL
jgi:VanZ family protein